MNKIKPTAARYRSILGASIASRLNKCCYRTPSNAASRSVKRPFFGAFFTALQAATLWTLLGHAHAQIYVAEGNNDIVGEYNATTGAAINANLIPGGVGFAQGILVSGNNLFVGVEDSRAIGEYNATTGATISANFTSSVLQGNPEGIAIAGNTLFVTDYNGNTAVGAYNATTGATINAFFLKLSNPFGLAVSGNTLYVSDSGTSVVGTYNATTGAAINASLITGLDQPNAIALFGNTLFVVTSNSGNLGSVTVGEYNATTGATINASFITGLTDSAGIAVSGNDLFVTNYSINGDTVAEYNAKTGALINANFITGIINPIGLSAVALPAADWLGETDGTWTGNNWASDSTGTPTTAIPTSASDITFSASGAANQGNTTLGQNFTIDSLTIATSTPVVINSNTGNTTIYTLTISGASATAITVDSGANLTINANVTLAGSSTTIEVDGSGVATINGALGGANFIKTGTGTLTLGGVADYTGTTTITGGTIALGVANALPTGTALSVSGALNLAGLNQQVASVTGSGNVTDSGAAATFTIDNSSADSFAGTITGGNLSLTKAGGGTLTLSSANSYGGSTTISAGTIADGIGNALPTGTALSVTGSLDLAGFSQQVASVTGSGSVTDSGIAATFTVNNSSSDSFAGKITGANLSLAKSGTSTLTLGSANTYGGSTTISAGTLADGINNALPTGTALSVTGTLDLAGHNQQVGSVTGLGTVTDSGAAATFTVSNASADSFGGTISGTNLSLTKSGAGTLSLSGGNTYGGGTTISAGALSINNAGALGSGNVTVNSGGVLLGTATFSLTNPDITLNGGSTIAAASGTVLTLAASNEIFFAEPGGGNLVFGSAGNLGKVAIGGSGDSAIATNPATTLEVAFGTLENGGGGNILGGATLRAASTTVDLGATLDVHDVSMTIGNLLGAGDVTLGSSAATVLTLKAGNFSGVISGAGQLDSTGALTLSGANTYGGGTTITTGTLTLGIANALPTNTALSVVGTLDLAGSNQQVGSVTGGGTVTDSSSASTFTVNNASGDSFGGSISGTNLSLTKTGAGTLSLSGADSYGGGTTINNGVLSINAGGTLGSGGITVNSGGTLLGVATLVLTNSFISINGGTTIAAATGTSLTLAPTRVFGFGNDEGGNIVFGSAGNLGTVAVGGSGLGLGGLSLSTTLEVAFGTLQNGGGLDFATENAASTTVDSGATLAVNDGSMRVYNLLGAGNVTLGSSASTVLTLGAGNFSGEISGAGQVTGAGAVTLSGASTYTGATTVQSGTLQVDGSLGNTAVTVQYGATLSGTGTIAGAVTIMSGGILSPGDAPGTLTVGSLALNSGSNTNYALGTPGVIGSNVNDLTIVNGNLTLGGTLNVTNAGGFGPGAYQLFQYSGTLTNNTLSLGTVPATYTAANFIVVTGVPNQVDLIVVPNGAAATTLFWDGAVTTGTGTIAGGSGTWSNFTTNFTNNTGTTNSVWQNGIAVFDRPLGGGTPGTVTLSGAINFAGLMFTTSGYVINSNNVAGTSFTAIGTPTNATNFASISVSAGVTATINAAIGGTAGLSVSGPGTLVLNGVNTYTGGTTITGGVVSINNSSALGTSGVSLGTGGELNSSANVALANEVTFAASGNSTLSAAAGMTFAPGAVALAGGNAVFGSAGNTGVVALGSLTTATVAAGSTIEVAYGTLQNAGGAANLSALTSQATSTTVDSGATLDVHDNATEIANFLGAGNVTLGTNAATVLTVDGGRFSGVISGAGQLTSAGTLFLTGANTYSGGTTITGGTLTLGDGFTAGASLGSNPVTINGGATLTLDLYSGETFANAVTDDGHIIADDRVSSNYTISGAISGSGDLTKTGGNTVALTGNSSYQGGTTINGGTLLVNNTAGSGTGSGPVTVNAGGTLGGNGTIGGAITLSSGGTIAPGAAAPGATLHAASLTWNGGGTLSLQLGSASDQLALTGALTKSTATTGAYSLNILDSGGIGNQSAYVLATFGSTNFVPTDFTLALPAGYSAALLETGTSLDLALTYAATGPVIQNAAPVGIPLIADFTVTGPVTTGGPSDNNTVNSLIFTPGGTLTIFNTLTVTSGNVTTGGGTNSINGGTLSGPNGLHFDVNGNLFIGSTLIGNASLTGGGALYLDGALYGNFQVLQGFLGGTGSIFGNLFNAGTVNPGDAPGTLHVSGNFTQSPAGTLVIRIGGNAPGQYDLLQVGGSANLGGTLRLVQVGSGPRLKIGQSVAFLTAAQGVNGKFSTVIDPFKGDTIVQPTVVYGADSVSLEGTQGSFEKLAKSDGLPPNEVAVARALDSAASDHRAASLIDYLDNRPLAKLPGDFVRLDPEQLTSMFTVTTALANVQSLNLQRRTDDIRTGSSGFSAAGLAMNGASPGYSGGLDLVSGVAGPAGLFGPDGKESKEVTAPAPALDERAGVFLSGTGEWVHVGDTGDARGYNMESGGFTLGADYKVCEHFAVGLSFGYTGTTSDLTDRGRIWTNGGKVGIYTTSYSDGWYVDTAVNGGYNSFDTRREALRGEARADADGGEFNALFGTGYDFKKGALTFGPTATFNYTYAGLNSFTEHGSLAPLDVHGSDEESLRTALGFKVNYEWKVGKVLVKPELRAAWQHEFGDTTYALDSSFASGAGDVFTVDGPKIGRDSALLSAGVAVQCSERCSTYVYYDGELGCMNYQSSSVSAGLRIEF